MTNSNFQIGQEVVRTKGDYVVGRIGVIIAIDEAKQRAQVDCDIKTWISFKALAPTSIPYEIVRTPGKNPKYFQKATSSPFGDDVASIDNPISHKVIYNGVEVEALCFGSVI